MAALADLKARRAEIAAANMEIVALADREERELTEEEQARIDAALAEIERLDAQIDRRERLEAAVRNGPGRRTQPEAEPRRGAPSLPRRDDARAGFSSFGDFAACVRQAAAGHAEAVARINAAATTFANENTGAEGGFAVPPAFREEIWQKVTGEESLMARTDQVPTTSNTLTIPKDETTPWGTAGIRAYWDSEGAAMTASRPSLEQTTLRLNRLTALIPVTEELLEDAPAISAYLQRAVVERMTAKINTAIVAGTGVGQPLGILNSGAKITVSKENSQPAGTVYHRNIVKMWSRMYGPCRARAVWLINHDVEPQLHLMSFQDATTNPVPAYLPANGVAGQPYGTLMGRPVIPVQACRTVGTEGDIILVDLSQYLMAVRGGMRSDVSMHLYFDQAISAFRFIMRLTGQPWWSAPISPEQGSNTLSCIVTLESR